MYNLKDALEVMEELTSYLKRSIPEYVKDSAETPEGKLIEEVYYVEKMLRRFEKEGIE